MDIELTPLQKFNLLVHECVGHVIWRQGGRSFPYLDCFGLLRFVYLETWGVDPNVSIFERAFSPKMLKDWDCPWKRVEKPEPGNVVEWLRDGIGFHVGVAVDDAHVLESDVPAVQVNRISERTSADVEVRFHAHRDCKKLI